MRLGQKVPSGSLDGVTRATSPFITAGTLAGIGALQYRRTASTRPRTLVGGLHLRIVRKEDPFTIYLFIIVPDPTQCRAPPFDGPHLFFSA